jgi:uncharacterized protein (DUF2164 family)
MGGFFWNQPLTDSANVVFVFLLTMGGFLWNQPVTDSITVLA